MGIWSGDVSEQTPGAENEPRALLDDQSQRPFGPDRSIASPLAQACRIPICEIQAEDLLPSRDERIEEACCLQEAPVADMPPERAGS